MTLELTFLYDGLLVTIPQVIDLEVRTLVCGHGTAVPCLLVHDRARPDRHDYALARMSDVRLTVLTVAS